MEPSSWAGLLEKSLSIAIILALGIVVVVLWRSREKLQRESVAEYKALQAKYTADLIKATEAMNSLATENLKQSFSDSAAWRDSVREFGDALRDHRRAIEAVQGQISASEAQIKQHVTDTVLRPRG